ncbi:minor tail protein [Microbacterium phage Cen1621]|uniref:Minor tail protein n=1 Tax=Microbacterium phage Cen1621 TaxID=2965191 RepID=A0A9E7TXK3_9CAUD|nr:minor tail protein [Microbacterium phage Cen1621]
MADYAYPKALTGLQDVQWSNFIAAFVPDGITSAAAFAPSANGSGMSVTLAPGEALVRGVLTGDASAATVAIAAAPASGSSRIDTIVKRLDRSGTPVIKTAVLTGTVASGGTTPQPKALTQDASGIWEWPVADVLVTGGVSSIAADKVTDRRSVPFWSGMTGATVPVAKGGTGVKTLNELRNALGLGNSTSAPLPVANGGTGAAGISLALLANLGIVISNTQPAAGTAILWAKRG